MMRVVVFLVLLAAVAAFNAMPTRSFSVGSFCLSGSVVAGTARWGGGDGDLLVALEECYL